MLSAQLTYSSKLCQSGYPVRCLRILGRNAHHEAIMLSNVSFLNDFVNVCLTIQLCYGLLQGFRVLCALKVLLLTVFTLESQRLLVVIRVLISELAPYRY